MFTKGSISSKYLMIILGCIILMIFILIGDRVYWRFFSHSEVNIDQHMRIQSAEKIEINNNTWVKLTIEVLKDPDLIFGRNPQSFKSMSGKNEFWGVETNLGRGRVPSSEELYYGYKINHDGLVELYFLLEQNTSDDIITSVVYRFPYIEVDKVSHYNVFELKADFSSLQKKIKSSGINLVSTKNVQNETIPNAEDYLKISATPLKRKIYEFNPNYDEIITYPVEIVIKNISHKTVYWANADSLKESSRIAAYYSLVDDFMIMQHNAVGLKKAKEDLFSLKPNESMTLTFLSKGFVPSYFKDANLKYFTWKFEYFSIDGKTIYQGDFELKTQEFPTQRGKNEI